MNYDEDFFNVLDNETTGYGDGTRDEAVERLQNKLGEYNSNWIDLDNIAYKNS
jgi:hypothetical protein